MWKLSVSQISNQNANLELVSNTNICTKKVNTSLFKEKGKGQVQTEAPGEDQSLYTIE